MLTNQLIDQHVGAIKLLSAQYRHDLSLEDIEDHEAITKSFEKSVREQTCILSNALVAVVTEATPAAVAVSLDKDQFKEILLQRVAEAEEILDSIPRAKAPFDPIACRASLLANARSLRSHWANKKTPRNELRVIQKICDLLNPDEDFRETRIPFDPDTTAEGIKASISAMVRYYQGRPKKTDQDKHALCFFDHLLDQYDEVRLTPAPKGFTVNSHPGYEALASALGGALNQAAVGKGKERHANDKPFTEQPIFHLSRIYGTGFLLGQAAKKLEESTGLPHDMAIEELRGAIVYTAAAIIQKTHTWTQAEREGF